MQSLVLTLKSQVEGAAAALELPLGWHDVPFTVPAGPHLRARILIDSTAPAGVLSNRWNKVTGRIPITAVAPIGQDAQVLGMLDEVAAFFPRGQPLTFTEGTGTITTPHKTAPASDGKRCNAGITINFYAFVKGDQ